ncbi:MAG: PD-(D/E)XK nuclease family protein, partial [Clostridia bacterium]|nr:PD-(D/E)XK nuclease family protein [Clostridia bacterium]
SSCISLLDMMLCAFDKNDEQKYITYPKVEEYTAPLDCDSADKEEAVTVNENFLKNLEYTYIYERISSLPEKLSVSELRAGLLEDGEYARKLKKSDFSAVPDFISGNVDASAIGTSNHLFMQFASFSNAEKNGARPEAARLYNIGMISEKQLKQLSFKKLDDFFSSDLYAMIKKSKKVYREKRFSISEPSYSFTKDGDENEKVLVQGVIDCFFENDDGTFTVVDYKTDRISAGEEQILIDRHKTQLMYYCRAVEAMTGKKVSSAYLYSFALSKEIKVM